MKTKSERLCCLDLLRGLDIFYLTVCTPFFAWTLGGKGVLPAWLEHQLHHHLTAFSDCGGVMTGVTVTDVAQPVFIFITGVAAVFAVSKRLDESGRPTFAYWRHLVMRLVLLWTLGFVIRDVLTFDRTQFTPYSDTLQTIAVAYLGAALALLIRSWRIRLSVPLVLLAVYGVIQATCGDYSRLGNVSRIVDERVFGAIGCKAKDFCYVLTTVAWMSMGALSAFVGQIIMSQRPAWQRMKAVAAIGVLSVIVGLVLSVWIPPNRYIYTVSFVFLTLGYAVLLLSLLFVLTDILRMRKGTRLFLVFGQCSLVAWMLHVPPLRCGLTAVAERLLIGLPSLGVPPETCRLCVSALVSVLVVVVVLLWHGRKNVGR